MEKMIVDFVVEKFGEEARPKEVIRWSDQCASQFKSRYTMGKLAGAVEGLGLQEDATVTWQFFETGEGKNSSDSLGAITKAAYHKASAVNRETTARTAREVIDLIKTEVKDDMKVLSFLEPL